jgi:hypothetical protein
VDGARPPRRSWSDVPVRGTSGPRRRFGGMARGPETHDEDLPRCLARFASRW